MLRTVVRIPTTQTLVFSGASAVSGVLLAMAFPPYGVAEMAWFALVPMLIVAQRAQGRATFGYGFLTGMVFWLINLFWLLRLADCGAALSVVSLGWLLLAATCSIYMGCFTWTASVLLAPLVGRERNAEGVPVAEPAGYIHRLLAVLGVVALWVGFEYVRSILFTGFPWNLIGISQYRNSVVIQVAEYGGVYAVSAAVMAVNVGFAATIAKMIDVLKKRHVRAFSIELAVGLGVCAALLSFGFRTLRAVPRVESGTLVTAAAVQPGIPQVQKWDENPISIAAIYDRLQKPTEAAAACKPDLIIWPETTLPDAINGLEALEFSRQMAQAGARYLLVGSLEKGLSEKGALLLYNSSLLFDSEGTLFDRYRKCHLVPFGEYLPFERTFPSLSRFAPLGFSCTPGDVQTIFTPAGLGVAFTALICFEDIMPYLARLRVLAGARLLINQTNDAWYERTAAAEQHMSHCVFRCVENRVPAIRSANMGATCFIDRNGRVDLLDAPEREGGFKLATALVEGPDKALTFYTRYGDLPFAMPCGGFSAGMLAVCALRARRRKPGVCA